MAERQHLEWQLVRPDDDVLLPLAGTVQADLAVGSVEDERGVVGISLRRQFSAAVGILRYRRDKWKEHPRHLVLLRYGNRAPGDCESGRAGGWGAVARTISGLGLEGWELVSVVATAMPGIASTELWFKRPIG